MKFRMVTQIGSLQGTDRYNLELKKNKMAAAAMVKNHKNRHITAAD